MLNALALFLDVLARELLALLACEVQHPIHLEEQSDAAFIFLTRSTTASMFMCPLSLASPALEAYLFPHVPTESDEQPILRNTECTIGSCVCVWCSCCSTTITSICLQMSSVTEVFAAHHY